MPASTAAAWITMAMSSSPHTTMVSSPRCPVVSARARLYFPPLTTRNQLGLGQAREKAGSATLPSAGCLGRGQPWFGFLGPQRGCQPPLLTALPHSTPSPIKATGAGE